MPRSSLNDLSGLLWRERDVLDLLLARLAAGEEGTDGLFRSISSLELHRAITAREAGLELGLEGEPTLQELIERAPSEWTGVLRGHLDALVRLAADVEDRLALVPAGSGPRTSLQRSLRAFLAA